MVTSHLNYLLADLRVQEMKQRAYEDAFRRTARASRRSWLRRLRASVRRGAGPAPTARLHGPLTLRHAASADEAQLAFLAALDSSPPLSLPVLLAEVDHEVRAAVSLVDRRVIAHPFHLADVNVALLLMAADHTHPGVAT
jgi:hypothetical protein